MEILKIRPLTDIRGSASALHPGSRGIRVKMWYNAWATMPTPSLSAFLQSSIFLNGPLNASSTWNEQYLFEAPTDVTNSRRDPTGPFGLFLGYFRPPTTSNYTFVVAVDDEAMLWIGDNSFNQSQMEMLLHSSDWGPSREWCAHHVDLL